MGQAVVDRGGSWIMHTGFHHWHDDVFPCIPQSEQDAEFFQFGSLVNLFCCVSVFLTSCS